MQQVRFGLSLDGERGWHARDALGSSTVGPLGLLTLLETQLGLARLPVSQAERVVQWRACLAAKETLQHSFRSRPALVALVNDLFGTAFAGLPRTDVELVPARKEYTQAPAVEDWLLDGKTSEQHQAIASGVAQLVNEGFLVMDRDDAQSRPIRPGDIAILARSNAAVQAIAAVLTGRKIASATKQPGLLSRPEVALALACLRRLNDDRDTIATAEIVSLAECEDPDRWLGDRLAWIDAGGDPSAWRDSGRRRGLPHLRRHCRAANATAGAVAPRSGGPRDRRLRVVAAGAAVADRGGARPHAARKSRPAHGVCR